MRPQNIGAWAIAGTMFVLGAAIGIAGFEHWRAWSSSSNFESVPEPIPSPPSPTIATSESLAEVIALQLDSGETKCPEADPLTFEACLLFQGALATWHSFGLPDKCPVTVDRRAASNPSSSPPAALLRREDALRASTTPCFAYLYAIHVANAAPVLVSSSNRRFQMVSPGPIPEPGSDAALCLQTRHGICGNQAAVGLALLDKAGLQARPLEFYYEGNGVRLNHIIPEVLIDGQWRPIDTTYGAYWTASRPGKPFALSTLDEVLSDSVSTTVIYNQALLPYGVYHAVSRPDFFDYLSDADIVRGGTGRVKLVLRGKAGVETFSAKPNFLGDNLADGVSTDGLSYQLITEPGKFEVAVNVSALAVEGNQSVQLCVDELCRTLEASGQRVLFEVASPKSVYIKSEIDVAYAVLSSIEWKRMQ